MKKARMVFIITILVMVIAINAILLAGCGNKYYYNKLFLHIKEVGEKQGESYRIIENYKSKSGEDMTFDLYVNKSYDHFIAITLKNEKTNHSLQLSLDPQLSGVYSIIPKIENAQGDDEYIMCEYNPITKEIKELSDTHCKAENKETILAINGELLDELLARFKAYIETHSAEMDDISWMKLGFEPRPVEIPETEDSVDTDAPAMNKNVA